MKATHRLAATLAVTAACLAAPAAAHAAIDLGVTQTTSAKKVKPGGTVNVTSTVTNLGTEAADANVELAALKGKILVFDTKNPYTTFSTSRGSCQEHSPRGLTPHALVCALGTLAPGQSAQIKATLRVRESAVQTTTLLPPPGGNEYTDAVKSNDAASKAVFLDVPAKVKGSKKLKLKGVPKSCVAGNFTLTAVSKVPGTKKMKMKADLGFDPRNGRHLLFSKEANGGKLKMKVPAKKAETQIDEGNFPTYTVIVKAKLGDGHTEIAKVEFKRC